ncbi:hypothetical protein [Spiroplasma endosymbiont of Tipula paludosa]|uniref:hypothetical protein n=1 Tax=Spiroplasma endosymbiont of Tipula paludosa TaxID=3066295 RepID=UPI0035C89601
MKKLLSMLTSISTIGSIMPMILANVSTKTENKNLQANNLERNKRETVLVNDYLESNNKDIKYFEKIEEIKESVNNILFDKNQNIYFSTTNELWFLKKGQTTAIGIEKIKSNIRIIAINNNILYVGTDNGAYFLEQDKKQLTKIEGLIGIINKIVFDSNNNVYFNVDYNYSNDLYICQIVKLSATKLFF